MKAKRKHRPGLSDLTPKNPESGSCCVYCGDTRNVPSGKYDGMCMSCYMDFIEDDLMLGIWKGVAV